MLLRPFNLLVLDEPTNHLDMLSKDILKQALAEYNGSVLVVSHDREFLSGLTTRTIEFRDGQLYEYLGDINFFLEKRKLDNMREVEKRTKSGGQSTGDTGVQVLGSADKKQLERNVQKAEKRIAELEAEVKKMEALMANPEFYNQKDAESKMKQYADLKTALSGVYSEWETAMEQLG
jgi:ATP-binding cassette subfamily F protein 3